MGNDDEPFKSDTEREKYALKSASIIYHIVSHCVIFHLAPTFNTFLLHNRAKYKFFFV